jgi:hypothetical protein
VSTPRFYDRRHNPPTMTKSAKPFSRRHGFQQPAKTIEVRDWAPSSLRFGVLQIARETGLAPPAIRDAVCGVLRIPPNRQNWTDFPNIWEECIELLENAPWFKVYDVVEAFYSRLKNTRLSEKDFLNAVNDLFVDEGIGWQLRNGLVEVRGGEDFETAMDRAQEKLEDEGYETASRELHEALRDLSRRPEPDVTGAVQHAMAALECVAREATGAPKATLGKILNSHDLDIPTPIQEALSKIWGYASEMGRHLREGRDPDFEEVELVVGLAASSVTYIATKLENE